MQMSETKNAPPISNARGKTGDADQQREVSPMLVDSNNTVHSETTQATQLIAAYVAADWKAYQASGTYPCNHPARRQAYGACQSARRKMLDAGISFSDFCHECKGEGRHMIPATPSVSRCGMCEGTGHSEWHNMQCPECKGLGKTIKAAWRIEPCGHCDGTRIEPKASNVIALDSAFDADKRAAR